MEKNPPAVPILADIAAALDAAADDLAALQARPDCDSLATTHAYAALLAARADVNECLDGLPTPPSGEQQDIEVAAVVEQLSELITVLGEYARASAGTVGLACARAAVNVDDARDHLVSGTP